MTLLNILRKAGNFLGKAYTGLEVAGALLNGAETLVNNLYGQTGGYEVLPQYPNYQMGGYGFRQQPIIQPIVLPPVFIQPQSPYFYNCGQMQPNYGMNPLSQLGYYPPINYLS